MKPKLRLLALALALVPLPAFASPSAPDTGAPDTGAPDTGAPDMGASGTDLLDLSLEELMDIEISSVSKRAQPLSRIPAAVHVISAEQIRRSGAANIPEALRLAPGVHVARFSNNRWSVSIRGFGGRFASKLLVLQDGRSLYSPLFSGVFWEFNDIPLELVERIEIVRGPGASLWGANAVNGVINIITRNAASAQGTQVSAAAGTELHGSLFASHGLALSDTTHLEVHARSQYVEPSSTPEDGRARDFWRTRQAGFRLDGKAAGDRFRLQGSVRDSMTGEHFMMPALAGRIPFLPANPSNELAYLLGRWDHVADGGITHSVQAYVERSRMDIVIARERRSTFDIEYQQQQRLGERVDFIWGAGWRHKRDEVVSGAPRFPSRFDSPRDRNDLFNLFAQGELELVPERWALTLGARVDRPDDARLAFQPNARILFTPDPAHSLWASAARAVRAGSRGERTVSGQLPARPLESPLTLGGNTYTRLAPRINGNPDFGHEYLDALDLGWRASWSSRLSTELAAYHYRYDDLRHAHRGAPAHLSPGVLTQTLTLDSTERARVSGIELSAQWRPTDAWDLAASLSMSRLSHSSVDGPTEFTEGTPERIFTLRTGYAISPTLQWDAWLRHASATQTYAFQPALRVDPYWTLDMRLGWKASRDLELSIVGQNLLDHRHTEAINEPLPSMINEVERGVHLRADWRF